MQVEDVVLEVRDRNLVRKGQITGPFLNLKAHVRWCGVGQWSLNLPGNHPMVGPLSAPGSGIILSGPVDKVRHLRTADAEPWDEPVTGVLFSGPTLAPRRARNPRNPDGTFTFVGVTDEVHLTDARAFPDPTNGDPETQALANDVQTDTTEALLRHYVGSNVVPGLAPAERIAGARQFLRLTVADLDRGIVQTKSPRFQNLLELCRELVAIDPTLGFRVVQDDDVLRFEVVDVRDRRATVQFDIENGTIASEEAQRQGASLTRAIVAGQGEGAERTIVQRTTDDATADEALWGRVIEDFIDQRDTDDLVELQQSGDEALAEGAGGTSVKIVPADEFTMRYGMDWLQGDLVTAVVNGAPADTQATEAVILIAGDGVRVGASLGDVTDFDPQDALAARVDALDQRVGRIERASQVITADMLPEITPDMLPAATEETAGIARQATVDETKDGLVDDAFVTPAALAEREADAVGDWVDISAFALTGTWQARRVGKMVEIAFTGVTTSIASASVPTEMNSATPGFTLLPVEFRPSVRNRWGHVYSAGYAGGVTVRPAGTFAISNRTGVAFTSTQGSIVYMVD